MAPSTRTGSSASSAPSSASCAPRSRRGRRPWGPASRRRRHDLPRLRGWLRVHGPVQALPRRPVPLLARRGAAVDEGRGGLLPGAGGMTFLVCEDGSEYTDRFKRFLGAQFRFLRAEEPPWTKAVGACFPAPAA